MKWMCYVSCWLLFYLCCRILIGLYIFVPDVCTRLQIFWVGFEFLWIDSPSSVSQTPHICIWNSMIDHQHCTESGILNAPILVLIWHYFPTLSPALFFGFKTSSHSVFSRNRIWSLRYKLSEDGILFIISEKHISQT